MKRISILFLALLIFYHSPLSFFNVTILEDHALTKSLPDNNSGCLLSFDVSDDGLNDPFLKDSEIRAGSIYFNYFNEDGKLKENIQFRHLLNAPFSILSQSLSDIVLTSILSSIRFLIPDSHFISLHGNQFSLRI